jgi:hypothetical protein
MIENEGENVPEGKRVMYRTQRWKKITSNYVKTFQMMLAFVLMLYNDVTSTTQL